jgi:hypothetical protein
MKRKHLKTWRSSLFTFAIGLSMVASLIFLPTVFAKIGVNLDQFQNGHPPPTGANWANGSINAQNSLFHEGESVPFRYFITGLKGITTHHFTIQWEYKKGGKPAYDYLTSFDRAPNGGYINTLTGGPCSNTSTKAPTDCVAPIPVGPTFPDPGAYGVGVDPVFTINVAASDRQLKAYNVASVTFGEYFVNGTTSDPQVNLVVTFTTTDLGNAGGTAGFFWGGHLARSTDWGAGNGASSISGAPFHMRTQNLDDGGATNQDRSVQPGAVVPEAGCAGLPIGTAVCAGSNTDYTASGSSATTAYTFTWTLTGAATFTTNGTQSLQTQGTGSSTVNVTANSVSSDSSYTIKVVISCSGCTDSTCEQPVTVHALPVVSILVAGTGECATSPSLTADGAQAGDTITWSASNGGVVPSGHAGDVTIYPTVAGTYSVQISRNGCLSNQPSGNLCFGSSFTPN